MKPSEHLIKSLNILRTDGWCRGQLEDSKGRHCLFGALYAVQDANANAVDRDALFESVEHLLRALDPSGRKSLIMFNDHDAKRRRDVERLFVKAIKDAHVKETLAAI